MSVLDYGIGQEDRERNHSAGKEGNEHQMGAGFGDKADSYGQQYHQCGITAYPTLQIDEMEQYADYEKDSESPCENTWKVLADNMFPEMFFHEMV